MKTTKSKPKPQIGLSESGAAIINETAIDCHVPIYIKESTLAKLIDFQSKDEDLSAAIERMLASLSSRVTKGYCEVHLKDSTIVWLNNARRSNQEYSDVIEMALRRGELSPESSAALEILSNNRTHEDKDMVGTIDRIFAERNEYRAKAIQLEDKYSGLLTAMKTLVRLL